MQLSLNIKDERVLDKLLWVLERFKNDGVEIIKEPKILTHDTVTCTDEYIEKNWKEIVSKSLKNHDINYENSFQYKIDRAEFLQMKDEL